MNILRSLLLYVLWTFLDRLVLGIRLGRAITTPGLIQMTLGGSDGVGKVLGRKMLCKTWKVDETLIKSIQEGATCW